MLSDLLVHFAFDKQDLRFDSAAVPHDATCTDCPTPTAGRVGSGAALFNATKCLTVPNTRTLQPATFTFAAWVRPRVSHTGTVFGRARDGANTLSNTFEIWVDLSPAWNVAVRGGRLGGASTAGAWQHYAATYDGTSVAVYVDGVFDATTPVVLMAYTPDDLAIGCDQNFGSFVQRFDGAIDDVRLYGRALTPAEVAALAAM